MQAMLAAVADPTRQDILHIIWNEEQSAGAIAGQLPVTFGAVSQHLAVLRTAGAVRMRQEGRQRFYLADKAALGPLAAILESMWHGQLRQLKAVSEQAEKRRRKAAARRRT